MADHRLELLVRRYKESCGSTLINIACAFGSEWYGKCQSHVVQRVKTQTDRAEQFGQKSTVRIIPGVLELF